jgi:hypothetical protein
MSLLNQKIPNLLSGVSQRPPTQRNPAQAEEQINALSTLSRGVMKRPPSKHVGKFTDDVTGWDDAFVHIINRDEDERYHVVVADGTIKIFDAVNSVEVPVLTPDGTDYLDNASGKGFRAVTVGDTTVIVNRGIKTAQGTAKSPAAVNEALLYVKQADFSTVYSVTLNDTLVQIRTVDMDTPASRQGISTDAIATDLLTALTSANINGFSYALVGSTIHVTCAGGKDFSLAVSDGLADTGLVGIKSQIQSFEDLPARAVNGFVVEVTGDVSTAKDNYFVQYDDLGQPGKAGVWRECPKPGTLLEFDATTMPHRLTLRAADQPPGVDLKELPHDGPPDSVLAVGALHDPVGSAGLGTEGWEILDDDGSINLWFSTILAFPGDTVSIGSAGVTTPALGGGSSARYGVVQYTISGVAQMVKTQTVDVVLRVNGVEVQRDHWGATDGNGNIVRPAATELSTLFGGASGTALVAENISVTDSITVKLEYGILTKGFLTKLVTVAAFSPRFYDAVGRRVTVAKSHRNPGTGTVSTSLPIGAAVTLNYGATAVTYTVPDDADSGTVEVAAGLYAAFVAASIAGVTPSYTTSFGFFDLASTDDTFPTITTSITYPANTFHNDTMGLTPDILVGSLFKNISDGSTGTVTANTSRTITVDALTGGSSNTFQNGDLCGISPIFIDPDIGTHYVFDQIPWKERAAGDTDVVTFPSFMGLPIADVFFFQDRLGFLCKENVILSSEDDLYNFFRYTATDLLPSDCIDIRSAHSEVTIFDSAFLWAGGLYVKSNNVWFVVSGSPALTPTTIRLDTVGMYPSSRDPRPVTMGEHAYFTRAKSGNTQVFQVSLTNSGTTSASVDITKDIPTYILGSPVAMVGDGAEGFLALLTDNDGQKTLYIFSSPSVQDTSISSYTQEHVQFSSWSKWTFAPGTRILGLDMADGVLGLIRKQSDGAYFEQIDLDLTPLGVEKVAHLDRRVTNPAAVFGSGHTDWTLPYAVATNGSEGDVTVVNTETNEVYTTTRPTTTTVRVTSATDLSAASVYVGQPYLYQYDPTQFFIRSGDAAPETAGRLQLRFITIFYRQTTDFTVTVSPLGRTAKVYTVTHAEPTDGEITIPIMCRNTNVELSITNNTPGPCALSEMDWEAWFTSRGRRI